MTGSLQIKNLSSGKAYYYIRLSYKDPISLKWKTKTVATKLEANGNKRKATSMINEAIDRYSYLEKINNQSDNPEIMLSAYLQIWINQKKYDLRNSTYESYVYRINRIKSYFEMKDVKVKDATPQIIDQFLKYSLQYGKTNQKTHEREPLQVRTVRDYKNVLNNVFSQAIIDGIIKYNPVAGLVVHGKRNSDYSEDLLFLSEEEITSLLSFMSTNYPQLLGITFIGIYYGLRRSEILGLKWNAIDFTKKTLSIQHTVVRQKTINIEDSTKTSSSRRTLSLFSSAEYCFKQIQKEQLANKEFYGKEYANLHGYVFTWEDGRPYNPNYISRLFEHATKEFGRPEITLHKLRHTCASLLISKGWDVKRVQYWLGHSDIKTTLNIYAHYDKHRLNSNVDDLNELTLNTGKLFN